MEAVFAETFARMHGLPCWNAKAGLFPSLTLEFGQPRLIVVREPRPPKPGWPRRMREQMAKRIVVVSGEWHLWIYLCQWSVSLNGKLAGDSSSPRRIDKAARTLNGQALVEVQLAPRGSRTVFQFDLGGVLETRPSDRRGEQGMLFGPTGMVLTLRADRRFHYGPGDQVEPPGSWIAIPGVRLSSLPA